MSKSFLSLSNLESGRPSSPAKTSSKFFFSDPHIVSTQPTVSEKKKTIKGTSGTSFVPIGTKNDGETNKSPFSEGIFGLSSETKNDSFSFLASTISFDQNLNPNIETGIEDYTTSGNSASVISVDDLFSVKEAEEYLKSSDIDKIFESYNNSASQLLTSSFDSISRPYDTALKLNNDLIEFQSSANTELIRLGKRKRESSEAVEILRYIFNLHCEKSIHTNEMFPSLHRNGITGVIPIDSHTDINKEK